MDREDNQDKNKNHQIEDIVEQNNQNLCLEVFQYNVIFEKERFFFWKSYQDKESFDKIRSGLAEHIIQEGVCPDYAKDYCVVRNRENEFI
jgi:hypothetical protein